MLNFLTSEEEDIDFELQYNQENIEKNLEDLAYNFDGDEDLSRFVNNQYTILSSIMTSVEKKNFEFFDFSKNFESSFLNFVDNYAEQLAALNKAYDIPFFYSLFMNLDQKRVFTNLCNFLVKIHDKNNMKIIKEEVKKNFSKNFSSEIFIEATKISSMDQTLNTMKHSNTDSNRSIREDFPGIEWVLDDENNFSEGIKIYLRIFRKLLSEKKWKRASEFNKDYLNKIITSNASFIRSLQDDGESRNLKTCVREKILLTNILDNIALSKDFTSKKVLVESSRIGESSLNIYGVDQFDHNRRKHNENFKALMNCLFVDKKYWVFDFIELIENDDSERAKELKELRLRLIQVLFECLVGMMKVCRDAKLQYEQM